MTQWRHHWVEDEDEEDVFDHMELIQTRIRRRRRISSALNFIESGKNVSSDNHDNLNGP